MAWGLLQARCAKDSVDASKILCHAGACVVRDAPRVALPESAHADAGPARGPEPRSQSSPA
eukprot:13507959-Alexandrium_andersonii.AAC.1